MTIPRPANFGPKSGTRSELLTGRHGKSEK